MGRLEGLSYFFFHSGKSCRLVLGNAVVACPLPVEFHLYLAVLFFQESCVAFQLRDVLVSSSYLVFQVSVALLAMQFFGLYNLGKCF